MPRAGGEAPFEECADEQRRRPGLGVGRVQNQTAEGWLLRPEHGRTSFGWSNLIGTLTGHKRRASLKLLAFLAPDWTLAGTSGARPNSSMAVRSVRYNGTI